MPQTINPGKEYRIVSLMHTHKKDKYITLWGPENAGYHYSKEMSGIYDGYEQGYHDQNGNMPITEEFAGLLFTPVNYEGKEKHMILNTANNHNKLGLVWKKGELVKDKNQNLCTS